MKKHSDLFRRGWRWLAAFTLTTAALVAHAAAPTAYTVTAPDGVPISVQEWGDPQGIPIVLVHGLLGSHLSWQAQTEDPALRRFRLITFDLRGHGLSGKPDRPGAYSDGRRWADDLAAVLAATDVDQPVLVGWSLGAAVITNYLAAYGDAQIGGAVYVGAVIELDPAQIVPHPDVYRGMAATDLRTRLDAMREFLSLCFASPPDPAVFQRLLANAAMASETMQRAVHKMTIDASAGLGNMTRPLLLIYGARDALVEHGASLERAMALNPSATQAIYATSGHAPFMEESERFGRDLAAFVESVRSH